VLELMLLLLRAIRLACRCQHDVVLQSRRSACRDAAAAAGASPANTRACSLRTPISAFGHSEIRIGSEPALGP
jgi:hypothetical protein